MAGSGRPSGVYRRYPSRSSGGSCSDRGSTSWSRPAIATFAIFHHELHATSIVFWFMMQLGMFAGFATAYPVNRWQLRKGVKEAM